MNKTSTTILKVESLAVGGSGVGKIDGKVTFVSGGVPGDRAIVRVVGEKRHMQRAVIVELLERGPGRRSPDCPFFAKCGGCQWLHITEDVQRTAKQIFLERATGLESPELIASPQPLGYRRLARLRFNGSTNKKLGFNAEGSSEIVDIPSCKVLDPGLNCSLAALREKLLPHCNVPGEIKLSKGDLGVGVYFVASEMFDPSFYLAAEACVPNDLFGVVTYIDSLFTVVAGSSNVSAEGIDGEPLLMPVGSFGQANGKVNHLLGKTVCNWVREGKFKRGIELFSGAGNLTVGLGESLKKLATVELDDRASAIARINIANRGLRGITVYKGEALEVYRKIGSKADLVILDPPRGGHAKLAEELTEANHRAIIYVSCDMATLGRDIEILRKGRYRPTRAVGFDMFPQTPHLEAAVMLERA